MKPIVNPVLPEHLERFRFFMAKWTTLLNLGDWRVHYSAKRTKNMAEVDIQLPDKLVTYKVGKSFGSTPVTDQSIEETCVHELWHVMLAEYADVITKRPHDFDAQMAAEHRIINVMERLLVPKPETKA
jgi:hypothetical protein